MHAYVPPAPATGRRKRIYQVGLFVGLFLLFVTWVLVIARVLPPTPTDDVVAAIMCVVLFTPYAALWDNPGESRSWVSRLAEFSFAWLLLSGIAQTFWELPWFFMDVTGVIHGIGPDETRRAEEPGRRVSLTLRLSSDSLLSLRGFLALYDQFAQRRDVGPR